MFLYYLWLKGIKSLPRLLAFIKTCVSFVLVSWY